MEDFDLMVENMVQVEEVEIKCVVKLIEHINKAHTSSVVVFETFYNMF